MVVFFSCFSRTACRLCSSIRELTNSLMICWAGARGFVVADFLVSLLFFFVDLAIVLFSLLTKFSFLCISVFWFFNFCVK